MNAHETSEHAISTDRDADESITDTGKLVPINESIRYRRRAQSAEKQAQELTDQLTQANETISQMSHDLEGLQHDQELTRKLSAAGATDLEAATLLAKARMEGQAEADIDTCVEQLRTEKRYLFGQPAEAVTPRRTAGVKDRVTHNQTALQRAATKAARSGNRTDLQHYLKLRRSLL
jgi:TolA-binding protein